MSYGWRQIGNVLTELCDECGFDSRHIDNEVHAARTVFELLEKLARDRHHARRPVNDTWSADEYLAHCLDMVSETIGVIVGGDPHGGPNIRDLREAAAATEVLVRDLTPNQRGVVLPFEAAFPVTPTWMIQHLLHDLEHHAWDIRRGYAALQLGETEGATVQR